MSSTVFSKSQRKQKTWNGFFEQVPDSPWQEALLSLRRQVLSNFEEDGELKARGKDAILNDELSYSRVFPDPDIMIREYAAELDRLLKISAVTKDLELFF